MRLGRLGRSGVEGGDSQCLSRNFFRCGSELFARVDDPPVEIHLENSPAVFDGFFVEAESDTLMPVVDSIHERLGLSDLEISGGHTHDLSYAGKIEVRPTSLSPKFGSKNVGQTHKKEQCI